MGTMLHGVGTWWHPCATCGGAVLLTSVSHVGGGAVKFSLTGNSKDSSSEVSEVSPVWARGGVVWLELVCPLVRGPSHVLLSTAPPSGHQLVLCCPQLYLASLGLGWLCSRWPQCHLQCLESQEGTTLLPFRLCRLSPLRSPPPRLGPSVSRTPRVTPAPPSCTPQWLGVASLCPLQSCSEVLSPGLCRSTEDEMSPLPDWCPHRKRQPWAQRHTSKGWGSGHAGDKSPGMQRL